jgi:hypothetical protein
MRWLHAPSAHRLLMLAFCVAQEEEKEGGQD